ncbi:MAG: hypothetical protein ACP5K7_08055 [Verrucomicrobiia bacterium]
MYKAINQWLPTYIRQPRVELPQSGFIHLIIAICDHFEPLHQTDKNGALKRMRFWKEHFPKIIERFSDSDAVPPRHTFFYPAEQTDPDILSELKTICDRTGAEVEVHLHHNADSSAALEDKLLKAVAEFRKYGFLCKDESGSIRYGFIHGDWALTNSHPQGLHCGVNNEIEILRKTGCYADFTMPSAPHPTQSKIINSIYYVKETNRPRSIDYGEPVRAFGNIVSKTNPTFSRPRENELLLVQGPLGLNWRWRKFGFLPRIENGDLTDINPPTLIRLKLWIRLHIHIAGKLDWIFIKLHTHGGIEKNMNMLLGEQMMSFHEQLKKFCQENARFKYHYVTAREMVNLIHSAEAGLDLSPHLCRNIRYKRDIK